MDRFSSESAATLAGNYAAALYDPYGDERAAERALDVDSFTCCENCALISTELTYLPFHEYFACPKCFAEAIAELEREPECSCLGMSGEYFDPSICELHNPNSEWNRLQSSLTAEPSDWFEKRMPVSSVSELQSNREVA